MTVIRDEWGVPHITAGSEIEAFRALGYAQAEDHLPQILRHYAMARGQAAAQFGPEWIPSDRNQLRWRHFDAACRQLRRMSAADRALYTAFMDGIRSYLNDHPEEQSPAAADLHPALPIATYRMFLWHFMSIDAIDAAVRGGVLDPQIVLDMTAMINLNQSASNQWVVMPQHTTEGALIFVSDPHGPIGEFPMFEYRLRAGRFDFIGVACAGAAPPILGHTNDVVWGSTTGAPRVSDCYLLPTRSGGNEYQRSGEWLPVERRAVTLEVAGGEPVAVELESVMLNDVDCPVIGRDGDRIAVACTPFMADDMPAMDETLLGWCAARNLADFTRAAALMSMFPSNVVAGDRYGDSLYVRLGLVPRRSEGVDPTVPIEGYDDRTRWHGFHPFEELVQIRNPACGYMHNNNEAPDTMFPGAAGSALAAEHYPAYLFNDTPGRTHDRGHRAEQVLGAGPVSIDDVLALALDDRWPSAPRWRDALAAAAGAGRNDWTANEQAVLRDLLAFAGDCRPESSAALAYYYWRMSLPLVCDPQPNEGEDGTREVFRVPTSVLDDSYPRSRELWSRVESGAALDDEQQKMLLDAVRLATCRLREDTGQVDATFGEVFRIGRGGNDWPARSVAFPAYVPEGLPTEEAVMPLRAMVALPADGAGARKVTSGGRSFRVVAFTDPIRSYSVVLYGQSSRPESPHYTDQCRLYSEGVARETGFATLLDR